MKARNNGARRFMDAILDQPDPPCLGCESFRLCSERKMACQAFMRYVRPRSKVKPEDSDFTPHRRYYNRLFTDIIGHHVVRHKE